MKLARSNHSYTSKLVNGNGTQERSKTFSLEEQRQEINEIAVDLDAVNTTLTSWNASQWDTAYGWGDHALAGYLLQHPLIKLIGIQHLDGEIMHLLVT